MSLFNNFPYSWQHQLNLDWIYEKIKHIPQNAILTVCKRKPTPDGNVELNAADVKAAGQVDGVSAVNGAVTLGAWRQINEKTPGLNGKGTISAADVGAATKQDIKEAAFPTASVKEVLFEVASGEATVNVTVPKTGYIVVLATNMGGSADDVIIDLHIGGYNNLGIYSRHMTAPAASAVQAGPIKLTGGAVITGTLQGSGFSEIDFYPEV